MIYDTPMLLMLQHGGRSCPFDTIVGFDSIFMGLSEIFPRLSSTFCSVVLPEPLEQVVICTCPKFCIPFLLVWAIGKSEDSLLG